jgi:hypothetical protein
LENTINKLKIIPINKYSNIFETVVPTKNTIPNWYKKSDLKIPLEKRTVDSNLNIYNPNATNFTYKACVPFLDAMTSGYSIVTTDDIEIVQVDGFTRILWKDISKELISTHNDFQWTGLICPEGYDQILYKFENEIAINTPNGYSSMFTHPINRFDLPFLSISGIVDTDKYPMPVHIPFFLKKGYSGIIQAGTPICQIFPFKREEWKKQDIEYSKEYSVRSKKSLFSKIVRSYKSQFWSKKTYI